MKAKLNAPFTVDNKQYPAGLNDMPENHFNIAKTLDVSGLPILTKEQTPLAVAVETPAGSTSK